MPGSNPASVNELSADERVTASGQAGHVTSGGNSLSSNHATSALRSVRVNREESSVNNTDMKTKEEKSALNLHDLSNNNHNDNSNESVNNDDFGSTDEVKIFNDEDERDGDVSESYQAELQAEKSSLIHESEQVNMNISLVRLTI